MKNIKDYIKKYKEKYALYYNNENLYVMDKKDHLYEEINDIIKKGSCKIPMYEGDWYELDLSDDLYSFNFFFYTFNIKRTNIIEFNDTDFKLFEHKECYTTKFLGTVKVSLTEQHKWSFRDLPRKEKEKLYEFFRQHPLRDEY